MSSLGVQIIKIVIIIMNEIDFMLVDQPGNNGKRTLDKLLRNNKITYEKLKLRKSGCRKLITRIADDTNQSVKNIYSFLMH